MPCQRLGKAAHRLRDVEPPGVRTAAGDERLLFSCRQFTLAAWIERRSVRVAQPCRPVCLCGGHRCLDLTAAHDRRIDEPHVSQPLERSSIEIEVIGLAPHRLFPAQSQPGEVIEDRRLELRTAARPVDILDPEQEASAHCGRHVVVDDGRQGMAEMKQAVRAGGKAENGLRWRRNGHRAALPWSGMKVIRFLQRRASLWTRKGRCVLWYAALLILEPAAI